MGSENVDYTVFRSRIEEMHRALESIKAADAAQNLLDDKIEQQSNTGATTPASGGDGGDMNTRITNLERDMTEVKVSLGKVETRLGHIDENMLTKGRAAVLALSAGIAIFAGGWWIVQQYLAPLVANIPK